MARHLDGENTAEDVPQVLDILLFCFHVHVDRPKIPPFGVRIHDTFEDGPTTLGIPELIFHLREF